MTGDLTQVDVPHGRSALAGVRGVLEGIQDIAFVELGAGDIVRQYVGGEDRGGL